MRRATLLLLAVAAVLVGCGGDDGDSGDSTRVKGDTLTIYASLPAHGWSARAGKAAEIGMRRALAERDGRVAGKRVRLVVMPSTRPGDQAWDPGTIEANAERAVTDPTTIAYIGELDQGGSAVSLPITNEADIVQVSPADGLTSLTRRPPGRPKAGPERYYPEEQRTFVRMVPPDLEVAREIVTTLRERPARRLAVLHGDRIADRELESMILWTARKGPPETVARVAVRDVDPDQRLEQADDAVEELIAARPDAVLYAGSAAPESLPVLDRLAQRLPSTPVLAGPQLADISNATHAAAGSCAFTAVEEPESLSGPAREVARGVRRHGLHRWTAHALLGHDAAVLVLDAVETGGADRRAVVAAAREPGVRAGALGRFAIDRRGDAEGRPVECVSLAAAL